jgi:hypothetical protein
MLQQRKLPKQQLPPKKQHLPMRHLQQKKHPQNDICKTLNLNLD